MGEGEAARQASDTGSPNQKCMRASSKFNPMNRKPWQNDAWISCPEL
jgi:hypothetical protein